MEKNKFVFRCRAMAGISTLALVASGVLVPAQAQTATTPLNLGTLGGSFSGAFALSSDGSVVVGDSSPSSSPSSTHAFRWTQAGGMIDLGTFGGVESYARGVSADGSVVVGDSSNSAGVFHAFRWTQAA